MVDKWRDYLDPYRDLFDPDFFTRWGSRDWEPGEADKRAASLLHTQISSRITTRPLAYSEGVETAALDSVFRLFDKTRRACDKNFGTTHFDVLAWDVLNTHVRPFTAKWHGPSTKGALSALDTTDEFRADLKALQPKLMLFDALLLDMRDGCRPPRATTSIEGNPAIREEMRLPLRWGISTTRSGLGAAVAAAMNADEREAIENRRRNYELQPDKVHATGLALSGGGIRSAVFSLGVLMALAKRDLLPQFDYLSTVSGGGYLGSFLTTFLASPPAPQQREEARPDDQPPNQAHAVEMAGEVQHPEQPPDNRPSDIGLRARELPFQREEGEAKALRYIRHRSKYLQTSPWERAKFAVAQVYGMILNAIALLMIPAVIALIEYLVRRFVPDYVVVLELALVVLLVVAGLAAPLVIRRRRHEGECVDRVLTWLAVGLAVLLAWSLLGVLHRWVADAASGWLIASLVLLGGTPALASAGSALLGRGYPRTQVGLAIVAGFSAPLFLLALDLGIYRWLEIAGFPAWAVVLVSVVVVGAILWFALDVNYTAPHRHYRRKLAETFLIQPFAPGSLEFKNNVPLLLSRAADTNRGPYHLINCALNVPGSDDPAMQGRLTDLFMFSPSYSGSALVGHHSTTDWERANPDLDLGTAMAISGAAGSPLMGLGTTRYLAFWMTLLNARLGYWVHKPVAAGNERGDAPGLSFLFREMFGRVDEKERYLNLTDGGHIENLGVYELLRRRCKYIVAIDGEHDPAMTFHALTNLQRLAAIDLGVTIDINLNDLRLGEKGLSRSHFQFCRIRYPKEPGEEQAIGYLLYLKLSLTGNEGEFIRRYRYDEPVFPHHSTANQFFTDTQFEAYRYLGEHVGDKLFLRAIVGDIAGARPVNLEDWFSATGQSMLEPLR
jgi:hypothetical protein